MSDVATTSTMSASAPALRADPARLEHWLQTFAELSEPGSGPGVTRLPYTPLERRAHEVFAGYMQELGLAVRTDAAGNTLAELAGTHDGLPALGTGSHLDSVPNGGGFDGIVGVVAGMETARLFTEYDVHPAHPVRFVAFAAEEGARFGQASTGSRIVTGLTDSDDLELIRDANGVTIAEAMRSVGLDPAGDEQAQWHPSDWAAFLELHIEQGAVLEAAKLPIGLVELISGSTRLALDLTGRAAHTGGTPMWLRADALAAAAEIVLLVEEIANDPRHRGTRATVGRLDAEPGSITTIAGHANVYVDVRDVDGDRQRATAAEIVARAQVLCNRRGIGVTVRTLADASPVLLPRWLREVVGTVCTELGREYRVLPSGAGHDAQIVNHITAAGMIFVPSRGGISHSPREWTEVADIAVGTEVLATALVRLDRTLRTPGTAR